MAVFRNHRCRYKTGICRKGQTCASRANRSEASDHENATACQGLPSRIDALPVREVLTMV